MNKLVYCRDCGKAYTSFETKDNNEIRTVKIGFSNDNHSCDECEELIQKDSVIYCISKYKGGEYHIWEFKYIDGANDPELKEIIKDFINKTHVLPYLHAKEGGIMEMEGFLLDFFKFVNNGTKR